MPLLSSTHLTPKLAQIGFGSSPILAPVRYTKEGDRIIRNMPSRTIRFPPVHMGLRQGGLELSLQTSVALELPDLPDRIADMRSYSDLVNAIQDDQLWIARHRSSYFSVTLTKASSNLSALERVMAADWIESYETWTRLGLRMVGANSDYNPSKISWSVQHPDLTSILAAPKQALTAEFREVRCTLELKKSSQDRQLAKGAKRRKIKHEASKPPQMSAQETGHINDGYIQEEKYDGLDAEGQRMVDEMLGFCSPEVNDDQATTGKRGGRATPGCLIPLEEFRGLIEGALEIALFGSSKRLNGIKILRDANVQGLTHLLPGVFHMPHLKTVSERASFLPVIATSLARMGNAESPSLRRKASDFQYGLAQLDMTTTPSEKMIQGIEKAAWCTLLKHARPPTLKPRNSAQAVQRPVTPVTSNREASREPTLVFGEMFASQVSSSCERSGLEDWKPGLQPGTPTIEVKRETTVPLATPMNTPEAFGQRMTNPTSIPFQNASTPAGTPAVPSPLSTPTLQIFGSPVTNTLSDVQFSQSSCGAFNSSHTPLINSQIPQGASFAMSNTQYYPSASQNQNCHLMSFQEQDIYSMGSQDLEFGMEASQQDVSQGNPADFASFGDFLGDVSMTDFGFGT